MIPSRDAYVRQAAEKDTGYGVGAGDAEESATHPAIPSQEAEGPRGKNPTRPSSVLDLDVVPMLAWSSPWGHRVGGVGSKDALGPPARFCRGRAVGSSLGSYPRGRGFESHPRHWSGELLRRRGRSTRPDLLKAAECRHDAASGRDHGDNLGRSSHRGPVFFHTQNPSTGHSR